MTKAPRSEESTGTTRRRRTTGGVGVAEGGRPPVGAAPRIRAMASTGPELDAELDQIAKDLQPISAGARASGVMPRQRKRDLREHLTRAQVHIRRATRAARAEAAGTMRSSASGTPDHHPGHRAAAAYPRRAPTSCASSRANSDRLRQELDAGAGQGEPTAPDRPTPRRSRCGGSSATRAEPRATPKRRCPRSWSKPSLPRSAATEATRRPLARIAGAAALVVVAAVAGLLLGRSTGDDATSSQPAIGPASSQPVDYERAVGGQLQELAEARSSALEQLRQAPSPTAQAAAGRDLAAAHRLAAVAIAATATPASLKAVKRRLVDGLTAWLMDTGNSHEERRTRTPAGTRTDGVRSERAEGDLGRDLNRIQEVPG